MFSYNLGQFFQIGFLRILGLREVTQWVSRNAGKSVDLLNFIFLSTYFMIILNYEYEVVFREKYVTSASLGAFAKL
jgi:hypothetical protein